MSARDTASGKQQQITITASSGLTKDEVGGGAPTAGGPPPGGAPPEDDVVDAEFEDTDERRKAS